MAVYVAKKPFYQVIERRDFLRAKAPFRWKLRKKLHSRARGRIGCSTCPGLDRGLFLVCGNSETRGLHFQGRLLDSTLIEEDARHPVFPRFARRMPFDAVHPRWTWCGAGWDYPRAGSSLQCAVTARRMGFTRLIVLSGRKRMGGTRFRHFTW